MRKVLVVDDDVRFLEMMEVILTSEGYQPRLCADAVEVAEVIQTEAPDVVILDVRMPGRSGWVLMDLVRTVLPKAGIIVCSAAVREVLDRQRALEQSGVSVLLKPFNVEELLNHLNRSASTAA